MKNRDSKYWFGLIMVIIGALLIVDNFGFFYFDFAHLIFSWHTIFIIIGAVMLSRYRNSVWGIGFLVLGLWGWGSHLLPQFFHVVWRDFWPIILIIIGFAILFRRKNSYTKSEQQNIADTSTNSTSQYGEQFLDINTFLTSTKKKIVTENFHGGKIINILGATVIDLSQSKLAASEQILDITCIFGSVEIAVPKKWKVIVNVSAVFGGIDDKRYAEYHSAEKEDGVLIIKGSVVFGACEILHYA
jgi:predicted membrane protein